MPETVDSSAPRQGRSLNVSEWPVTRKVALVLAIPLLLAVALGGLRVQTELSKASAASSTSSQVTVLGPAVAYLSAAEDAAIVFRKTDDEQQRDAALAAVNGAAASLEGAWSQADLSEAQRQQVQALLDSTQGLRDGEAYSIVSTAVDQLERLEAGITLGIATMTDAGSRTESLIRAVGHLNAGRLSVTEQQLLVVQRPEIIPKNELYGHLGVESAAIGSLELLLPGDASIGLLRQYNASNSGLLGIGTPELKGQQPLRLYDQLAADLLGEIEGALSAEATASKRTALLTAVLIGLALLVAVALALLVSRILVRSIQRVRDGALQVAHERLPDTVRRIRAGQQPGVIEPIAVTTHEEMGQLARAVDDLHGTAVRLAQDEAELRTRVADMFVTLSRRNTSLVNQQLWLIEKLERDEEDPARLESLFRLDHLASRMRRTAESLVVLADAPAQSSEQDALSVDEALHAAAAGVQEYQRVRVSGAPALRISGGAAPDVVHLFTELVDNALAFSPPTSPVTVTTTTPAGLVLVEIADAGLGIDQATLLELNETLRTGAEVTADTARRMGLFVVARLARRHGLTVALERNAEGGTTAKVFIPRPLLASPDAPAVEVVPVKDHTAPEVTDLADVLLRRPAEATGVTEMTEVEHLDDGAPDEPTRVPAARVVEVEPAPAPVPVTNDVEPVVNGTVPVTNGVAPIGLDTLSAVINANIRLPQREPGTASQPVPLTPVLPRRAPTADPVAFQPVVAAGPDPDEAEPDLEPDAAVETEPEARVPEALADEMPELPGALPEPMALEPVRNEPISPLVDPLPTAVLDDHADDDETPLFRMLRSGWFSTAGDDHAWDAGGVDAGWRAADRAADRATDAAPSRLTVNGLPVRDPGNRLVPGGVAQPAPAVHRDPEAIKARLAAHAAGVARGRNVAGFLDSDRSTETEDVTS